MRNTIVVALVAACGSHSPNGTGDATVSGDTPITTPLDAFAGPFSDFPTNPIVDGTAPGGAGGLFGDPSSSAPTGGPCLVEPEVGTLYPHNWLRPRFSWIGGGNLFELRITAANQVNPLIVYTTNTSWTMPADLWALLRTHTVDAPITVTVRGGTYDGTNLTGGAIGSHGDIAISSTDAPGAIVYWTTSGGTGLRGFSVGDETVKDIVRPADAGSKCVGCHSSTPDGTYVGFSSSQDAGNGDPTTLGMLSSDGTKTTPPFISAAAKTLVARVGQEEPVFSKQHWAAGDRVAVTMYSVASKFELVWTDLETASTDQGTGWGVVARGGDANMAASGSFAHTTDTMLYTSAPAVNSGVTTTHGDLATVPYGNRAGGTAAKIAGASEATFNEYYPTFSPDDALIAFNRVADGESSYNNAHAEVFAIRAAGGTATRLAANDPPACSGKASPGVTNSWPKWAPAVGSSSGSRTYWLTFSSTRTGNPQLYVTAVVDDGAKLTTYPALYLWNQPPAENNHTPAWDNFTIVQ